MRHLHDQGTDLLSSAELGDVALHDSIGLIAERLASMGGKARIASIPVGRRTVFGEYRDDPTQREDVTLLIVFDETRPLARAELFIHTRKVAEGEADGPEMLSRSDEDRPKHLLIDGGYPHEGWH